MASAVLRGRGGVAAHRIRGAHRPRRPARRGARCSRPRRCYSRRRPVSAPALIRVFPPDAQAYTTTRLVYLIGYELPPRLTAADLALFWRWDVAVRHARRARRLLVPLRRCAGCAAAACRGRRSERVLAGGVRGTARGHELGHRRVRACCLQRAHGPTHAARHAGAGAPGASATASASRWRAQARTTRARLLDLLDSPSARLSRQPAGRLDDGGGHPVRALRHRAVRGDRAGALGPPRHGRRRSSAPGCCCTRPVLGNPLAGRGLPPVGQIVMVFARDGPARGVRGVAAEPAGPNAGRSPT